MKKFLIAAGALFFLTSATQAQTTHADNTVKHHRGAFSHHKGGLKDLNLSDDQKKQMKELGESYHNKIADLRTKSLSADDLKAQTQALHKEHFEKMQSLLTADQKAKLVADRKAFGDKAGKGFGARGGKNFEQMKSELGLSDDQAAKLKASREGFRDKVKTIRANSSLTDEQKKEQVKALSKEQHESLKSILTADQIAKMRAGRKNKFGSK